MDVAVVALGDAEGSAVRPGPDLAAGVRYGDVSAFTDLAAGNYAVSIRAAGAGPAVPPVLSIRVAVPPGGARTVAITGRFADLGLRVLAEDLSSPPPGSARVRVLAAAGAAATVDMSIPGGPALAGGLPFGSAGAPAVVPAAPAILRVDGAPAPPADLPLNFAAGSVTTLLVLDRPGGGLTVRPVLDAAGPTIVPSGGVDAGGGGTAGTGLPGTLAGLALTAGAALATRGRGRALLMAGALAVAPLIPGPPAVGATTPPAARSVAPVAPVPSQPQPAEPVRLTVPTAGIDTALTGVALDTSGTLPAPPETAGWYRQGPAPGQPGPAVVTGHVDSRHGPAVFFRLADVAVGDPVLVDRADGTTARFTVTRVARYPKTALPAATVYGPTPDAQLRLITCGGTFDRAARSYLDDVVVYAGLQP